MWNERTKQATDFFQKAIKSFAGEYESLHFRFVVYESENGYIPLMGRIIYHDLPAKEVPPFSFKGDLSPCHLVEWVEPVPAGTETLVNAIRDGEFLPPSPGKPIRLVDASEEDAEELIWSFHDQAHLWEDNPSIPYPSFRLYWSGKAPVGILPNTALRQVSARAVKYAFENLDQVVNSQGVNVGFSVNNAVTIEVSAPVRVRIQKCELVDDTIKAVVGCGLKCDLSKLSIGYQVQSDVNWTSLPIDSGSVTLTPELGQRAGRVLEYSFQRRVKTGKTAKVLVGYGDSISLNANATALIETIKKLRASPEFQPQATASAKSQTKPDLEKQFPGPVRQAMADLLHLFVINEKDDGPFGAADSAEAASRVLRDAGIPARLIGSYATGLQGTRASISEYLDDLTNRGIEYALLDLAQVVLSRCQVSSLDVNAAKQHVQTQFVGRDASQIHRRILVLVESLGKSFVYDGKALRKQAISEDEWVVLEKTFYRIGASLGRGGNGQVNRAYRGGEAFPCAIKVYSPNPAHDDESNRKRFEREYLWLKGAEHPHIMRVYDYGEIAGCLAYTMELMESTLAQALPKMSNDPSVRLRPVIDVLRALEHSHAQAPPVIHRDIKPANILIGKDGRARLSDWGIARIDLDSIPEDLRDLSSETAVLAPKHYASPEQILRHHDRVGPKSDIFMVGLVLYEVLSGERATRIPPSSIPASIPKSLHPILIGALSSDIDARPTASQFASEVEKLCS